MNNIQQKLWDASDGDTIESLRQQLAYAQDLVKTREEALASWIRANDNKLATIQKLNDHVTMLREWAVEAVEFVGNMKWSPSVESQGRRVIAATELK